MAMHARAARDRRRRRMALASSFAALLIVLGIFAMLWQRSVRMTNVSEARRLHMLAEDAFEADNTLSLALATASLEREDSPAVRRVALKALWAAPIRFALPLADTLYGRACALLSPDGEWLATESRNGALLWPRDGGVPRRLEADPTPVPYRTWWLDFHPKGHLMLTVRMTVDVADRTSPYFYTIWSVPDGAKVRTWEGQLTEEIDDWLPTAPSLRGDPARVFVAELEGQNLPWRWFRYSLDRDEPEDLGRANTSVEQLREEQVDPAGRCLLDSKGAGVYLFPLDSLETARPILVGRHDHDVLGVGIHESGTLVVSADKRGGIRVWSRKDDEIYEPALTRQTNETVIRFVGFDRSASRVVYTAQGTFQVALLDRAMPAAEPTLFFPVFLIDWPAQWTFPPDDSWIVFARAPGDEVYFYPLERRRPKVLRTFIRDEKHRLQCFVAGGSSLVSFKLPELWLCDVVASAPDCRMIWQHPSGRYIRWCVSDPLGRYVLANSMVNGEAYLIPLDGSPPRSLGGFKSITGGVALSKDARRAAVGSACYGTDYLPDPDDRGVIRIWDLASGDLQLLKSGGTAGFNGIWFLNGERLVSCSTEGLLLWDLTRGTHEVLSTREHLYLGGLDASERYLVVDTPLGATLWDLERRAERVLPIPSDIISSLAISPDGRFVAAGTTDGEVWVLSLDEEEPYVMLGHEGNVGALFIPPASDRVYSAATDGTVRIWDVPHSRPLHNLPIAELLATIRAQTNLRVVVDAKAEKGYRVEYDKFPGWKTAPIW